MQKTFKIGESALGGIIRVRKSTNNKITYKITCLDHTTKETIAWDYAYSTEDLRNKLENYTSHYYAEVMTNHFKK